ncbi:ERF family protein [Streptomyces lavendulae]|uniref:ERF family protein n=1 Tax=Streptomyces lavendulae TaxID=1914 RepID=UPI0031E6CD91
MTVTTLPTPLTDPRVAPELAARLIEAVAGGTAAVPAPAPSTYEPAPAGAPADAPRVFAAIAAVMRDTMPVGKTQQNTQQNYKFRGIDDVMSAMAGPMRAHGVFILPAIAGTRQERDGKMTRTVITMRYRVYGPAGDCLVAEVPGEAFDFADKSMNKAQSAALKYLLFTLFMLPVDGRSIDDGDRDHPVQPTPEHRAELAELQQRQRGQGRQRGQQQERRPGRAERSTRDQSPAPAGAQPTRDYLAEAGAAQSPEQFAQVRAAAVTAGAPAEYLARLDAVAAQKRAKATQAAAGAAPGQQGEEDQEHAAALGEMYDAAKAAGLDRGEADQAFSARHQVQPAEATVAQLREQRDDLLDVVRGDGA